MIDANTVLFVSILLAGFYMAWNIGANDVANAMGTSVGSGALTLKRAVIIAAVLEFSGAFFFGSHVTETVQSGIINSSIFADNPIIYVYGMLASLIGVGIWLQLATYFGWPVSGTHSIVGALVGFGAVVGGIEAIYWENVSMIVVSWVLSPLFGGLLGFSLFMLLRKKVFWNPHPLRAAKAVMPFLVFMVVTTLALLFFYNGLHNLHLDFSVLETVSLSAFVGTLAGLSSIFMIRNIALPEVEVKKQALWFPEVYKSLEKTKKHLHRVLSDAPHEMSHKVETLLAEVEALKENVAHPEEYESSNMEFVLIEKMFGYLQILSACLMAFAHGANDVANAVGPLAAAILVLKSGSVYGAAEVPTWALLIGGVGIVIGLATWGWRVIETIGKKLTELTPTRGFAAEFAAALTILVASRFGMPISTTHTLVGAVIGVGLARGLEALNLSVMRDIFLSWMITIPAGAALTMAVFWILTAF